MQIGQRIDHIQVWTNHSKFNDKYNVVFSSTQKSQSKRYDWLRNSYKTNPTPHIDRNRSERCNDKRINQIYSDRTTRRHSHKPSKRPKFDDLGILKRNQKWLDNKNKKIEEQRKHKKSRETDGCTFEPQLNKSRRSFNRSKLSARSNNSSTAKSNRSYSDIHGTKHSIGGNSYHLQSETHCLHLVLKFLGYKYMKIFLYLIIDFSFYYSHENLKTSANKLINYLENWNFV